MSTISTEAQQGPARDFAAIVAPAGEVQTAQRFAALMCQAGKLRRVFVNPDEARQWERQQQEMRRADLIWRSGR